jgi:hypothetical protein
MQMTNRVSVVALGLVATIAIGCEDALVAENLNNPERERVFALPAAIEQILGSGYQLCRNTEKGQDMTAQLAVMSGESYSALNNFNMGPRDAIPRAPILNSPAASQALYGNFGGWSRQSRLLALSLAQLDSIRGAEADGAALASAARDIRARAVGFFNLGCTLGWLSLAYDSAAIVDHTEQDVNIVPPLSSYKEVNAAALAFLDSAIAVVGTGTDASAGFPAEALWFGGNALSRADFVRLARSMKARFRADVARTKAERDAVDWAKVAADADNGISQDFLVNIGGSTGWSIGFQSSQQHVSAAWAQLTVMYNGFADTSGAYQTWLQTPVLFRSPVNETLVIRTPDKRWPQGNDFTAQRAAGPIGSGQPPSYTTYPYNRVRAAGDWSPGDPWGESWYSNYRYKYIRNNSSQGQFPDVLKAEMNILAAEAYLRIGDMTNGLQRLNISRVAAGLPAATGTSINSLLTGSACVPRVPQAPTYTTVACGSLLEAVKYEWRMEMAYNRLGAWFFAGRGWEDLVGGTPLFYPVPFEELGARQSAFYNVGGGGYGTAPVGTYKF